MRFGRKVKAKQEPMKWVKQRAVTLNKRRQQELAKAEGGEDIMQGLYSEQQTEVFIPPPIQDVRAASLLYRAMGSLMADGRSRESFHKTRLEIWIFMLQQCYRKEPYIFLVSVSSPLANMQLMFE
jgi:hypothetical protein